MKKQQRTPNKATIKADKIDFMAHISKRTLFDYRLTDSESINLIRLLSLSDNFYISLHATSEYLNISVDKLKRIFKNLKALGYLTITKEGNKYKYHIRQESLYINDFKPYLIESYSYAQLNAYYNNAETPSKYKNLIKKYFDSLSQDINTFNNVLNEIKDFETPKDILKTQQETEQEQQNEQDIIKYLK